MMREMSYSAFRALRLRKALAASSPTNRSAYSQAAPLDLPCDLTRLATGMSFRNVDTSGLYVEMGGSLYVNGD